MSCWLDYGSSRHVSFDIKVFAITTVDVYKYTPLLIFNAVVFLNASNHRKCVKKEKEAWSPTYAWLSVSRKQMSKYDCTPAHAHAHACAHTCTPVWTHPSVNLVTQ